MRIIISDSSTLILLEKIELLHEILKKDKVIIPNEVYKEAVLKGKETNHPDAFELEKKIKNKLIQIVKIKDKKRFNEIKTNFNLAEGETEALVLFHEGKGNIVAVDDLKAMKYCEYYKLPFATSVDFVLDTFNKKQISAKKAEEMIKDLGVYGRYKDEIIFYALNHIKGDENE